jgi:hypothetical protein
MANYTLCPDCGKTIRNERCAKCGYGLTTEEYDNITDDDSGNFLNEDDMDYINNWMNNNNSEVLPEAESLNEMPDIEKVGKKVFGGEKELKNLTLDEVEENIVLFITKESNFMYAAGSMWIYFMDTAENAKKLASQNGEIDLLMFPFKRRYDFQSAPIKDVWKKNKNYKGTEHILAMADGEVTDDLIFIDKISVRPGYKRATIATKMVDILRQSRPNAKIQITGMTPEGAEFFSKYTGTEKQKFVKDGQTEPTVNGKDTRYRVNKFDSNLKMENPKTDEEIASENPKSKQMGESKSLKESNRAKWQSSNALAASKYIHSKLLDDVYYIPTTDKKLNKTEMQVISKALEFMESKGLIGKEVGANGNEYYALPQINIASEDIYDVFDEMFVLIESKKNKPMIKKNEVNILTKLLEKYTGKKVILKEETFGGGISSNGMLGGIKKPAPEKVYDAEYCKFAFSKETKNAMWYRKPSGLLTNIPRQYETNIDMLSDEAFYFLKNLIKIDEKSIEAIDHAINMIPELNGQSCFLVGFDAYDYLVDTGGYDYVRYITRLTGKKVNQL